MIGHAVSSDDQPFPSKRVQEFHLDVYLKCPPLPVTTRVQPQWDRCEKQNMYAVVTTTATLPKPQISVRVIRKRSGTGGDEELDLLNLHDYRTEARPNHAPHLQAKSDGLSVQVRWKLPRMNASDSEFYRRSQVVFLTRDVCDTFVTAINPLLKVAPVGPDVPPAHSDKISGTVLAQSTSALTSGPTRFGSSTTTVASAMHRSQTALQLRSQNAGPPSSSTVEPSSVGTAKGASRVKRKQLAAVDEDVEMRDHSQTLNETQPSAPPKQKRTKPSPIKTIRPVETTARRHSSSSSNHSNRGSTSTVRRPAPPVPAATRSTDEPSSSSLSSPRDSDSPTTAGQRRPKALKDPYTPDRRPPPASVRAPAQKVQAPPLAPTKSHADLPAPERVTHTSSSTTRDFMDTSSPVSTAPAAGLAPVPASRLQPALVVRALTAFDDLSGIDFGGPTVVQTVSEADPQPNHATAKLISFGDSPTESLVVPQAAAPVPAGTTVTLGANGKAVDPAERGNGVCAAETANVEADVELPLEQMEDDELGKLVDGVMGEESFPDLVRRIEKMMVIDEEE